MKTLLGCLLLAVTISNGPPAEQAQVGQSFFQKVDQVSRAINQENWPKATRATSQLNALYQKKKWKVQIVGDEGEYEGLERELAKLTVAVKEKSKLEAQTEASDIRALFQAIYTF